MAADSTEHQAMARIGKLCRQLIGPSLVPIYIRPGQQDVNVCQIGTGFLILHRDRPALLTAKHVLYGHKFDESPFEKYIVFDGKLRPLFELKSDSIVKATEYDLCWLFVDELETTRCLPETRLNGSQPPSNLISIYGLLARDFRRSIKDGALRPKPFLCTNTRTVVGRGYVAMNYPRARNVDTHSRRRVTVPIPAGLSGCPMIYAGRLIKGEVSILGVFTDYRRFFQHL